MTNTTTTTLSINDTADGRIVLTIPLGSNNGEEVTMNYSTIVRSGTPEPTLPVSVSVTIPSNTVFALSEMLRGWPTPTRHHFPRLSAWLGQFLTSDGRWSW